MTTTPMVYVAAAEIDDAPPFSEEALALEFADRHSGEVRYVAIWNKWYF